MILLKCVVHDYLSSFIQSDHFFSGVVVEVAVVGLNALKKLIAKQLLMCCHVPGSGTRRYIHISTELCERVAWVGRLKKDKEKEHSACIKAMDNV